MLKDRQLRAAYAKKDRAENLERYREYDRVAYSKDPEKYRAKHLKRLYGLTIEDYSNRLIAQNGVCAICGEKDENKELAVDHDRTCCEGRQSCGECLRGLLCFKCNTALGRFSTIANLEKAIAYLKSYTTGNS